MSKEPCLLVDSHHGIYCWQILFQQFKNHISTDLEKKVPVIQEDIDIILAGPSHEDYWEVIDDLTTKGLYMHTTDGDKLDIIQDEDIWAVPHGTSLWDEEDEDEDEDELYVSPERDRLETDGVGRCFSDADPGL